MERVDLERKVVDFGKNGVYLVALEREGRVKLVRGN